MIFPSLNLSKEECDGALRRLELETYSNLISVFRAQGCLTNEKYKILENMRRLLFITDERHRAESRRAANDEYLATIANMVFGPNSELQWLKEGKRLFPLLNRKAPLSSLTNVANSAAKYSLYKKPQEYLKKADEKKTQESIKKQEANKSTSCLYHEIQSNKNMEALKNLYALSNPSTVNSEKTNSLENIDAINKVVNINALTSAELKLEYHKNEKIESYPCEIKQPENKVIINQYEIDKIIEPSNTTRTLDKGKFIVVNSEIQKSVGSLNLVGNILSLKRKSSEKLSEIVDISENKYLKAEIVKDPSEFKSITVPTLDNILNQPKLNSNQSTVSVQKIINPFVFENVKVPANTIHLKDIQNRKAVKLITAPNGKIFIQPAQGSTNRIANIRPLTTVIKPNQCIALKKVTSLGAVSELQSKPIKISKANMIILPKTTLNPKPCENSENIELITKGQHLPKISIQSVTTTVPNSIPKTTQTGECQNQIGPTQGNVFVIGSVINQSIATTDHNKKILINIDNEIDRDDDYKNLITEDTPVDIIPSPLEEIYKTETVKIISPTTVINSNKETRDISNDTQLLDDDQDNLHVYSTTDWELELDQEAAQRNKERSNNSDEDNFNSVIEEIVEEATEDSFSEYEESCQYDGASSS